MAGFSKKISLRAARRAQFKCEKCGENLAPRKKNEVARYHVHSASLLHLVKNDDGKYVVTYVTEGVIDVNKGDIVTDNYFLVMQWGFPDDAYFLCPSCHRDIHVRALEETKIEYPGYKGNLPDPSICERVTMDMVVGRI